MRRSSHRCPDDGDLRAAGEGVAFGDVGDAQQLSMSSRVLLDPAGQPFCLTSAANW